ncbi:MAG: DsbA family protein [Pseudomonadota bacterium]
MAQRTRLLVIGAVVVAAIVVAVVVAAILTSGGGDEAPQAGVELPGSAETRALLQGIPQNGAVIGAADAPVTLVEYADLQCPYCAQWATNAFPDLVEQYVRPGKVRIEFRGLAFIGPDSEKALRAAYAAGDQRKLWEVVELLYQHQGTENTGWVTDDLLSAVATSAPLDEAPWRDAFDSSAVDTAMQASASAAETAGIRSTPSFLVGPTGGTLERVEVQSLDAAGLQPALDDALAAAR